MAVSRFPDVDFLPPLPSVGRELLVLPLCCCSTSACRGGIIKCGCGVTRGGGGGGGKGGTGPGGGEVVVVFVASYTRISIKSPTLIAAGGEHEDDEEEEGSVTLVLDVLPAAPLVVAPPDLLLLT